VKLSPRSLSLRTQLVVAMTALLGTMALAVYTFFPARMEGFSRQWVERRARGVAMVLVAPAAAGLEFDNADTVNELLAGLSTSPEIRYAVVRREDGSLFAAFHPERAPEPLPVQAGELRVQVTGKELRLDAHMRAKGGARGVLTVGTSLAELEAEVQANRNVVAGVSLALFILGLLLSFAVGTLLIRPIQRMTDVALSIARGDLSQTELMVASDNEAAKLSHAFNRMVRSLRQLSAAADRMAAGDLTTKLDMEGQVAEAFNRMVEAQRSVVSEIANTSVQLGAAAAQILAAAQHQQGAATRQSEGVDAVRRTMESLLQSASHIADSARGVLKNAELSRETTEATSSRIGELNRHANRMTEMLDVIRDIADRSDLLALNASLEATRAGEAGRAFGLVAAEMRRLAERVTATVADVKSLVTDVRSSATTTVMVTEEARKLADSTTESARQITMVTQQQRTGTEQVSGSMVEIATLLGQYVAGTQETRSLAAGLKGQAEKLERLVGRFVMSRPEGPPRGQA
jgi:methyl-accepting chemotaxis protein